MTYATSKIDWEEKSLEEVIVEDAEETTKVHSNHTWGVAGCKKCLAKGSIGYDENGELIDTKELTYV